MRSCTILIRNAIVGMAVCYASSCIVVVRALSYNVPTSRSYNNGVDVSSTVANVDNPLMQQESLPKFSRIKPHHLTPAVESMLAKLQWDFYQLENALSSSMNDDDDGIEYDQILPELERIKFALEYTWGVASHLTAVKNDNELRQAYETNQRKVVQAMAQFSQSKPLYSALLQLERKLEIIQDYDDSFLMRQKRRAVEKTLRSMKQGGVGLEVAKKERLNEIRMRLAALSTSFSNNMLDETQAFSITIYHSKTLRGVPESVKCLWHNAHRQFVARRSGNPSEFNKPLGFLSWGGNGPMSYEEELYEEEVGNFGWSMGPWRITLDQPSYLAAMMHIPERSLRQQICMAYLRRASETNPSKNNIPLINEMLQLKNEMANILGYGNYAELSISSKMASSVDCITKLTDLVAEKAIPVAQRELDEITAYAREHGGAEYAEETLKKLEPWDITYWTERLKESQFDLTEEEIRPYFALPSVLDGLFHLVDRLFDVSIQKGFAETWHTDVSFYNVFDNKSGLHIASFYFDPYARATNKRGGAWMSSCIGKSNAVNTDLPVAYVTCNTTPPHKGKPSLLTFREVQSLFHECGHALQHLLTKASVGDVSGINGIELDAVEIPSQFMERWCYDRTTLYSFAKHWQTHRPLPPDKFEKICQQKVFNAGMTTCKQLYFGRLDLELHGNYDPEKNTIFDIQKEVALHYVPHALPLAEDRFLCSFSHIFAGGYSAGYYSYLWAEVMSADAFCAFEDAGLEDDEEVQRIGRLFRDTFLSLGGGVPPKEVFEQFRGRQPTPGALLRHLGLSPDDRSISQQKADNYTMQP